MVFKLRGFYWAFFLLICSFVFVTSCTKNNFETSADAIINTSADTLRFDTVFVSSGSIVKQFKISNNNSKKMLINNIRLGGGASSFFKMNVNGQSTFSASNIEIAKNDSIYIFIQVNINANMATLPFVVSDSVLIDYNGKQHKVQLEAYGKNAIFIRNGILKTPTNFTNTLPYVILGTLIVDTFGSLTIPQGSRIFCHANAAIVINGSLIVQGNNADTLGRVIFTGDRLDEGYKDLPASWPGIVFTKLSRNNNIKGAIIKNAFQAIAIDEQGTVPIPKLVLENTVIENAYDYGLLAINNSINASNCLIFNCGINIALLQGGAYNFEHCTSAGLNTNYILRRNPSLITTNFSGPTGAIISNPITANFKNCIFWGDASSLVLDEIKVFRQGGTIYNVNFNKCLYRNTNAMPDALFTAPIINTNPQFDSINGSKNYYSFKLKATSPALNVGATTSLTSDINNKTRSIGLPDLGCYEKQ
jgi:hypothetical protein